jgi:hypothetical protein
MPVGPSRSPCHGNPGSDRPGRSGGTAAGLPPAVTEAERGGRPPGSHPDRVIRAPRRRTDPPPARSVPVPRRRSTSWGSGCGQRRESAPERRHRPPPSPLSRVAAGSGSGNRRGLPEAAGNGVGHRPQGHGMPRRPEPDRLDRTRLHRTAGCGTTRVRSPRRTGGRRIAGSASPSSGGSVEAALGVVGRASDVGADHLGSFLARTEGSAWFRSADPRFGLGWTSLASAPCLFPMLRTVGFTVRMRYFIWGMAIQARTRSRGMSGL